MEKFLKQKTKHKIFIIALFIGLPFLVWYLIQSASQIISDSVNQKVDQTIQTAIFEQESWILRTKQLLETMASISEINEGKVPECSELFKNMQEIYPRYTGFALIDLKGDIFCSNLPTVGMPNVADRPYFQKVLKDKVFSIGEYQIGRLSGKPTIIFANPIFDKNAGLKHVLVASLDLTWLESLFEGIDLPDNSTMLVIDRTGLVLSRVPEGEWVGQKVPEGEILEKVLETGHVGPFEAVGLDGVRRIYTHASFSAPEEGIYFVVGLPIGFQYFNKQILGITLPYLAVLAVTLVMILGFSFTRRNHA